MEEVKKYPPNSLLVASKQIAGRGKDNRVWYSNKSNNIYASLLLEIKNNDIDYSNYTFLTSLAIAKTTIKLTNEQVNIKCKWPNDVLLNNKKFCGILLERDLQKNTLIIGFGVNVDYHPDLTGQAAFESTDLLTEGFTIDRKQFVEKFIDIFESLEKELQTYGFKSIKNEWLLYAYNFKQKVTIKNKNREFVGTFKGLDDDGTLIVDIEGKRQVKILSADIF